VRAPRAQAILRFLRIPAAPTAPADVLAGFSVAAAAGRPLTGLAFACGASAALYLGGMGLNDVRDREHDAVHRPTRPLPSGALDLRTARAIVAACFATGLGLAFVAGRTCLVLATILAAAIAAYDLGGKRVPLVGPLLMGSCRALNLALGIAAGGWSASVLPILHGIYTTSLTLGAAHEEGARVPRRFVGYAAACAAAPLAASGFVPLPWPALVVASSLAILLAAAAIRAARSGAVADARAWVKYAVLGFLLYDAAILAGCGRPLVAAALVASFPVCLALGRAFPPS
jgi:4-hydroxybenzoate polyprenyltransferase